MGVVSFRQLREDQDVGEVLVLNHHDLAHLDEFEDDEYDDEDHDGDDDADEADDEADDADDDAESRLPTATLSKRDGR